MKLSRPQTMHVSLQCATPERSGIERRKSRQRNLPTAFVAVETGGAQRRGGSLRSFETGSIAGGPGVMQKLCSEKLWAEINRLAHRAKRKEAAVAFVSNDDGVKLATDQRL